MTTKLSVKVVKVVPGTSINKISGWLGDSLKIRVRAQPEKGKANKAALELLAKELDLPVKKLSISSGHASSNKIVEIMGITDAELIGKF